MVRRRGPRGRGTRVRGGPALAGFASEAAMASAGSGVEATVGRCSGRAALGVAAGGRRRIVGRYVAA